MMTKLHQIILNKRWIVLALISLSILATENLRAQLTYCSAQHTDPTAVSSFVSNVTFGSINNVTGANFPTNGYSYWPSATTVVSPGTSLSLSISISPTSSPIATPANVAVWFDWNLDGLLSSSEYTLVGTNMTSAGSPYTQNITVPFSAVGGVTRMRVRSRKSTGSIGPNDACISMGSGETEDYNITVAIPSPCIGNPNAGAAVTSSSSVCLGQFLGLSLNGVSIASGLSYQWEEAPSVNGPWTPLSASQNIPTFSYAPMTSGKLYYRCQVTCNTSTAISSIDSAVIAAPLTAGSYTINPSGSGTNNFTSISAAISALSCGFSGSITFNLAPNNIFNEQVTIPANLGTSLSKTITFNGNGDTLVFSGTASAPWTLGLNGADFISFNNLVVKGTDPNYALVVRLWNQADTNTFNNCTFLTQPNVTSQLAVPFSIGGAPIGIPGQAASGHGNVLQNCHLLNGHDGVYLNGNSTSITSADRGNRIVNSVVKDFYRYGVYSYYQQGLRIVADTIERPARTVLSNFYGIYLSTTTTDALIEKNVIRNAYGGDVGNTGSAYGIYCSSGSSLGPNRFINNLITGFNGKTTGNYYGIYLSAGNQRVLHNTIAFTDTTVTSGVITGLYASGTAGMAIRNNIICIQQPGTGAKQALHFSGGSKNSNFNNLYLNSPGGSNYIGYYSNASTYAFSLPSWKSLGFDTSSITEDPLFVGSAANNFIPTNGQMDNRGIGGLGVTTDIAGVGRLTGSPDIGAHEYGAPNCSGSVVAGTAAGPIAACAGAPFLLSLSGYSSGGGVNIQWESAPTGTGSFSPIVGATTSNYIVVASTTPRDYRAVVTCVMGGLMDLSNTVTVNINPFYLCYCGPYTTGSTLHSAGLNYITAVSITGTTLNSQSAQGAGATVLDGYSQSWPINSANSNTANLVQGMQYTVNAVIPFSNYRVSGWLDVNGNGVFDTSEYIAMMPTTSLGLNYSGSFTVPSSSVTGYVGLRLRVGYLPGYTAAQPCATINQGYETEDYVVNLTQSSSCSGVPNAGVGYAVDSVCPNVPILLTDTGYSYGQGILFQWERSLVGTGVWTPIVGATNPTFTDSAGITSPTDFRFKVTCSNSNAFTCSDSLRVYPKAGPCYCIPVGAVATYGIKNFSTTGAITDISNLNSGLSPGGYGDFTNIALTTTPGATINFSVSFNSGTNGFAIWIDWGKDGSFADAGDLMYHTTSFQSAVVGSFIIPVAATGATRMRIMSHGLSANPSGQYCSTGNGFSEWEDYVVALTPAQTCAPATGVTAGSVWFNAATIAWNQSTSIPSVGYQWKVVSQGAGPNSQAVVSGIEVAGDTIASVSGLSAVSNYTFHVRTICAPGDTSFWATLNFITPCSTFLAPFVQTFNVGVTPTCWTNSSSNQNGWMFGTGLANPSHDVSGSTDHSGIPGSTFAWVSGSSVTGGNTAILTSPVIDVSGLTNARLRYYVKSYNPNYFATHGNNRLVVSALDMNTLTWVTLDSIQQSLTSGAWQQRTRPMSSITSSTTQLRFKFTATATISFYNDILIDDIHLESTPTCPVPTAVTASNTTQTTVDLNWTENGTATNWEIQYGPVGFVLGSGTVVSVSSKPHTLAGLNSGTAYTVYVRSICGLNDTSGWALPQVVPTVPSNDSCAFAIDVTNGNVYNGYTNFATQSIPACEPTTPIAYDVWYKFTTGSISGNVTVTVISTSNMVVEVFTGSCVGALNPVTALTSSSGAQSCINGSLTGTEYGTFAVNANTTYLVRVYGYNGGQGNFTIQVNGAPLSIPDINISASNFGGRNRIVWVDRIVSKDVIYEVERSADGIEFAKLGIIESDGRSSSYHYWDDNPVYGSSFYRLKIKFSSGLSDYSKIVKAISGNTHDAPVLVFPNPINNWLTVTRELSTAEGSVTISDAQGRIVKQEVIEGTIRVDMRDFASGVYFVKYADANYSKVFKVYKCK